MSGNLWMFSDMLDDEDAKMIQHEFVTYYEGADYYGLGLKVFTRLAHEAGAVYKIGKRVLIRRDIFEEYLRILRRKEDTSEMDENMKSEDNDMRQIKRGGGRMKTAYWSLVSMASAMLILLQPVMADTIWNRFSTIMKDVYGQLVGISTIVAVTAAAIALIVRMISRNQRAVDEATSWLKRIVVTWIVLNSLGFIVAYLQPLIAGGNYTG